MGYFTSLHTSELPHREVAVFMYLRDCAAMGTNAKRYTIMQFNRVLEKTPGYFLRI